jgi:hypothetical protein
MAACRMAKLRVGCTVGGWAPGVRTIVSSSRFQSMTTDPGISPNPGTPCPDAPVAPVALADATPVAPQTNATPTTPAINLILIIRLLPTARDTRRYAPGLQRPSP